MASNVMKAMAATLLVLGSGAATAQGASPASTTQAPTSQRVGDSVEGANALEGTTAWILAAISLGLIIWGIIEFSSDQNNSNSP